jgi:glutamate synthase domain-containing protein 2
MPGIVGLAKTHKRFVEAGVRDQVTLTLSGGIIGSFFDAFLFGADRIGIGTLALIGDGCVMLRKCHTNECSTGVATTNPALIQKNKGGPLNIARVLWTAAELTAQDMAPYVRTVAEAVGRSTLFTPNLNGPILGHGRYVAPAPAPQFTAFKLPPISHSVGSYIEKETIENLRQANPDVS